MLKKRVLQKAVDEINEKTDIVVSYNLENEGRKVVAINLFVEAKENNALSHNASHTIEEKLKEF